MQVQNFGLEFFLVKARLMARVRNHFHRRNDAHAQTNGDIITPFVMRFIQSEVVNHVSKKDDRQAPESLGEVFHYRDES